MIGFDKKQVLLTALKEGYEFKGNNTLTNEKNYDLYYIDKNGNTSVAYFFNESGICTNFSTCYLDLNAETINTMIEFLNRTYSVIDANKTWYDYNKNRKITAELISNAGVFRLNYEELK
jgi:hypothetical protein